MARPAASEESRIRKLRAALDRAIAQDLVGETLTLQPMAKLLLVSRPVLTEWLSEPEIESSGAFVPGSKADQYCFNPIATIWVLIRWWEGKRDEQVRKNLRIREAVAGDKLDGAPSEMTIKDATDAYRLALQILTAEKEAGRLVDVNEAESRFNSLVTAIREGLLSAPQKLDPTSEWSPEFREKFDNALADCMVLLRQAGQDSLSPINEPVPPSPDGKGQRAAQRTASGRSRKAGAKRTGTAATA